MHSHPPYLVMNLSGAPQYSPPSCEITSNPSSVRGGNRPPSHKVGFAGRDVPDSLLRARRGPGFQFPTSSAPENDMVGVLITPVCVRSDPIISTERIASNMLPMRSELFTTPTTSPFLIR